MKICTKCQREYPNESIFCLDDGGLLVHQETRVASVSAVPPSPAPRENPAPRVMLSNNSHTPPAAPPPTVLSATAPPAREKPVSRPPQKVSRVARKFRVSHCWRD